SWSCGRPSKMEAHLVNTYQSNINNNSDEILAVHEQNEIDKDVLKAWIAAGIPFDIINNPFLLNDAIIPSIDELLFQFDH
ncbi:1130_t:CDS:2, partial [Scutellospora calospora]